MNTYQDLPNNLGDTWVIAVVGNDANTVLVEAWSSQDLLPSTLIDRRCW